MMNDLWKNLFAPEMDFVTKLLVIVLILSLFVEACYMISPRFLRHYIAKLDRASLLHNSMSANAAFAFGSWTAVCKL